MNIDIQRRPRISRLPRWMHHVYAVVTRHFWLPCSTCRRPFGGHEWKPVNDVWQDAAITSGIRAACPPCSRYAATQLMADAERVSRLVAAGFAVRVKPQRNQHELEA